LRIGRDGRVALDGDVDERQRERSYALLTAPRALLLGVEAGREAPESGALIFAGDLTRIAFTEVVSLIAHGRTSGVLRVYGPSAVRSVVFDEGEVRGALSQRIGEGLSEIAVRLGLIKRDEMSRLVAEAGDPRRAGRLAVERGLLSERALWNAVQEHVTTVFQGILQEASGSFVFSDERVDEALMVPGLSAEGLLMEGVRRLDELRALRSGGGSDGEPARVLAAFNEAFRDIFATAEDAGAGAALHRAAASVFDDDPVHVMFRGVRFTPDGELPPEPLLPMLAAHDDAEGRDPGEVLADTLSTLMLFLLFVAGEHLEPKVHQQLHSRVKARVSRD
jgi:hypothetical protein